MSSAAANNQPQTIQIRSAQLVTDIVGSPSGASHTTSEESTAAKSAALSGSSGAHSPEATAALKAWKQATALSMACSVTLLVKPSRLKCVALINGSLSCPLVVRRRKTIAKRLRGKKELQAALPSSWPRDSFSYRVQPGPAVRVASDVPISPTVARSQRQRQLAEHPWVSKLCELLQGEVVRVDPPVTGQISSPHSSPNAAAEATASPEMVDAL